MTDSTQANFDSLKNSDAHAQGVDGGLNLKTDAGRLSPPATTRADNALYVAPGNVQQLPAPSSVMQANTSHVYNLHARDLQAPATYGDLMVHGEVRDNAASTTNLFTSPVWTDGNGASVNTAQPMPPWNTRTRVMTGKMNVTDNNCAQWNMMTVVQEQYTSQSTRRYGIGYFDGTNIRFTFGLCDGTLETNDSLVYAASGDYCECAAVQGTNYWIAVVCNGATITRYSFDFTGAFLGSFQIVTNALGVSTTAGQTFNPMTILQHAGRTFIVYITNPSGQNDVVMMYDQLGGNTLTTALSTSSVPKQGFAAFSPYTHQASASATFFCVVNNSQVCVLGMSSPTANPVLLNTPANLTWASNVGSSTSEGTVNYCMTGAACIFDTQGGVGANAKLGLTLFRSYPEQVTAGTNQSVPYGSIWYQAVSVDTFCFTSSSSSGGLSTGTITSVASNVVRSASGMVLASKAWGGAPPEANYAGSSQAKNAYCVIRCGSNEPYKGNTPYSNSTYNAYALYGQPTYFVIDHQARIVSRAFESLGPIESFYASQAAVQPSGNGYSRTTYWGNGPMPKALGMPMLLAPANDLSCLDITMPLWTQTDQKPQRIIQWAGTAWYANAPSVANFQPTALNFSVSAQDASVPAVQAGPYSVLSGPLTCIHDGRGVVEANYHFQCHNPIPLVTTQSGTSTTAMFPPGSYYWIAVWEWYDSLGRVHRSAPSLPVGAYIGPTIYGTGATVTVPLPPTPKNAVGGNMYLRVYRSTVNGNSGVFYYIGSTVMTPMASGNTSAVVYDSYICDPSTAAAAQAYSLSSMARLYTSLTSDGATVYTFASTPPPPFVWQCSSRGRAFGLAQVNGQHRLYYSSVAQSQFPFEWNIYNYAPIPPEIGDVRSIEAIDDKVVIFGTRSNAYLSGTGPATANTYGIPAIGEGFDTVVPIPTPQGTIGTGAPCRGPDGIYFQGFSGIQLAGRDLTTSPVGAAVDNITGRQFNNQGIVFGRACMVPSLQSIVWPNPAGPALVYNYLTQKWSTWPLLSYAACIVQRLDGAVFAALQPVSAGKYAGLATSSTIGADIVQLGTSYAPICLNSNTQPTLVIETPWILPSGESGGESNVWDVTCTGNWLGPHTLKVETCINYQTSYSQSVSFNYATQPQFYQARVRPQTSRVWAVRYRLSLLPISTLSSNYQMASLSDLVVNFGSKQGTTRLGASMSG